MSKFVFKECCKAVLAESKNPGNMPYAKSYAQAGLSLDDPEAIRTQCLYILNNISHWRGETATTTRAALKRLSS